MNGRLAAGIRRTAHRLAHRLRRDRGAVFVEFAGIFPLILLMMAVIWQCILIGYTFNLAGNAADQGARAAAAAEGDPQTACADAAREHLPNAWEAEVSCPLEGDIRTARVNLQVPALFPGALDFPFEITGTAGTTEEGP
jgi:TadE-like protein